MKAAREPLGSHHSPPGPPGVSDALGESMETHFGRIKTAIADSELSEPLKAAVLSGISLNDASAWASLPSMCQRKRRCQPWVSAFSPARATRPSK
jgi:hypothetical protein